MRILVRAHSSFETPFIVKKIILPANNPLRGYTMVPQSRMLQLINQSDKKGEAGHYCCTYGTIITKLRTRNNVIKWKVLI